MSSMQETHFARVQVLVSSPTTNAEQSCTASGETRGTRKDPGQGPVFRPGAGGLGTASARGIHAEPDGRVPPGDAHQGNHGGRNRGGRAPGGGVPGGEPPSP